MAKNENIVAEVLKSFVGSETLVQKVFITLLAGGHVLLEDIPGVGKTTLAVAFSKVLALSCKRIQFTPDVMPTDVTGFTMLRPGTQRLEYQPGAVMCNLLLADEINRASTRSQSALLEAMEESSVTVDGVTHPLPQPFMVIATQNPTGSAGTQLLPDSQTDRFMTRLSIGYPEEDAELKMMQRKHGEHGSAEINKVSDADELLEMRRQVAAVYIEQDVYRYILALSRATRTHSQIQQGASPRCTVALMAMSQAAAFVAGRDFVVPEDVKSVYIDCTAHRLILTQQAHRDALNERDILKGLLQAVEAPGLRAN